MDINIGINEKIVTGRKFRRLIDKDSKLWQLISWWTKARDVEFDDGKTAEQKLGNINGITSDLYNDRDDIASSISAVHNVVEEMHRRINHFRIYKDEDGNIYIIDENEGADAVPKKLDDGDPEAFSTGGDAEYLFAENTPYAYCLKCGYADDKENDNIGVAQTSKNESSINIKLPNMEKYTNVVGGTDSWADPESGMSLTKISFKYTRAGTGGGGYGVYLFLLKDIPAGTMIKSGIIIFK